MYKEHSPFVGLKPMQKYAKARELIFDAIANDKTGKIAIKGLAEKLNCVNSLFTARETDSPIKLALLHLIAEGKIGAELTDGGFYRRFFIPEGVSKTFKHPQVLFPKAPEAMANSPKDSDDSVIAAAYTTFLNLVISRARAKANSDAQKTVHDITADYNRTIKQQEDKLLELNAKYKSLEALKDALCGKITLLEERIDNGVMISGFQPNEEATPAQLGPRPAPEPNPNEPVVVKKESVFEKIKKSFL